VPLNVSMIFSRHWPAMRHATSPSAGGWAA
jgi:hypothetical protein